MSNVLFMLGQGIAALCGAAAGVAWAFAMWVPSAGLTLTGFSFVVALLMALLALFAVIAAVRGHAAVLVILFLASFFPVGAVLMTADHWLQWVGRADLGFLAGAVLMWLGGRLGRQAGNSVGLEPSNQEPRR